MHVLDTQSIASGIIYTLMCGPMQNLQYIIVNCATKHAIWTDPAWETEEVLGWLNECGYTLSSVFLTHTHYDHVNGLCDVLRWFPNVRVYLTKEELGFYTGSVGSNTHLLKDGERFEANGFMFTGIHAFGHTPGSVCFQVDTYLITGDVLFVGGCGRCDLKGGSSEQMFYSLMKLKNNLPDSLIILPGHDYGDMLSDTLAHQIQVNPFFQNSTLENFLIQRN